MFAKSYFKKNYMLPKIVTDNIKTYFGKEGLSWVGDFNKHLTSVCQEWELSDVRPYSNLSVNFVAKVRLKNHSTAVLKMGFPNTDFRTECFALQHFDGEGAVKLLKSNPDDGQMLLECIEPGRPLDADPNDDEATTIAAKTMKKLWTPAQDESAYPTVVDWFQGLANLRLRFDGGTGPFEEKLVAKAESISNELLSSMGEKVVLHGDLHHDNIVSSSKQGWIIIDPKGVVGEREYEVGALLRNPDPDSYRMNFHRRVQILSEVLGFDKDRMIHWTFAQAVLSGVWDVDSPSESWKPIIEWAKELGSTL